MEGTYRRNDENEIIVTTPTTRYAVQHLLHIGTDFEVDVTMETSRENLRIGGAGIHFSNQTFNLKNSSTCHVRELDSGVRQCKIANHQYSSYLKETIPTSDETKISLTCHLDRWRVSINDTPIHKGSVKLKKSHLYPDSCLCLGGWRSMPGDDFELTYRSLKIRKLDPPDKNDI